MFNYKGLRKASADLSNFRKKNNNDMLFPNVNGNNYCSLNLTLCYIFLSNFSYAKKLLVTYQLVMV